MTTSPHASSNKSTGHDADTTPHGDHTRHDIAEQSPQTPGNSIRQVRPPYGPRMPLPGVSDPSLIRRTALVRTPTRPVLLRNTDDGYPMTHAYVRRFWVAALGPGAVADLLRLAAAAHGGRSLPTPTHLSALLVHGLVVRAGETIGVRKTVPDLPPTLRARLSPSLRRQILALECTAA